MLIRSIVAPSLYLIALIAIFGPSGLHAQHSSPDASAARKLLESLPSAKAQKGRLTILTPKDLSGLTASQVSTLMLGDPCETAAPISIGQTVTGELTPQDCVAPDGSYADFYRFQGQANQHIVLRLDSAAFDTYLGVTEEFGEFVREDDDGGEGTNSLISVVLPSTGPYIILANSAFPAQTGTYNLSLTLFEPCTFSLGVEAINPPPLGGQFTFSVNTQTGCDWSFINTPSFATFSRYSGTGTATVTMTVGINDIESTRVGYVNVFGGSNILTVTQTSLACNESISPASVDAPPAGGTGEIAITVESGCSWGVLTPLNDPWLQVVSGPPDPRGSGTLTYRVFPFYGSGTRTTRMRIRDTFFNVTQTGQACTFTISPMFVTAPAAGASGVINVTTQPGCPYSVGNSFMVQFPGMGQPPPTGSGQLQYTVLPNPNRGARWLDVTFQGAGGNAITLPFRQAGTNHKPIVDFDADSRTDLSVRRPSDNNWYLLRGSAGYTVMTWGVEGDLMAPADYDGDAKTDIAVFRPSEGKWYIVMSATGAFQQFNWGQAGDLPVPADRDGDGRSDLTVYRGGDSTWYTRFADGSFFQTQFGAEGDKPLIGDFDGDGKADSAVFRPSENNWYLRRTTSGYTVMTWGQPGDVPVHADYDGDGATDVAVFRPSTGQWYRARSTAGFDAVNWGQAGDIPVPADYDGDGKADAAVFRPSEGNWYINGSSSGFVTVPFGQAGDVPTPAAFLY